MKALLTLGLLLLTLMAYAQTPIKEGTVVIGGSVDAGVATGESGRTFNFMLNPSGGMFLSDRVMLGTDLFSGLSLGKDYQGLNLGGGLFTRYYLGTKRISPFLHAGGGASLLSHNYAETTHPVRNFGLYGRVGVGVSFFVNKNVALDAALDYNVGQSYFGPRTQRVGGRVGFRLFF